MEKKETILIIEDDIHYGEMLQDAMVDSGYNAFLAYSATGGMDIVRQKKIDMIISDINMPSVNGIQLAEKLMNMYLDIPIILITGADDLALIRHALKLGVIDYLIKPVNLQELPLVIEKNLERKRLESQRLQENKAEILLKALKALMRALDAKDAYTCGHSHRVAALAMLMARELGLKPEQQYTLQLAALLHDLGKIGMPDSILNKNASLKDYEFNIAKDHPVVGSQIIGEIEELSEVASAVRHHHERYDGTGYPDGLRGEAIPFFARILSIIDTYEALVSDRVYRKATDKDLALAEIQNNAGIQFDPELVKVFMRIMHNVSRNTEIPESDKSFLLEPGTQRKAKEAI
jgi:putative nucleotidyltransferase with HDIG domain